MQAEDRRFTLRNLKLIAVIAAGMVSFFAVLDHFAYPEHIALFAVLRWTCALVTMAMLVMVRGRIGKRYFRFFTVALPLVPAFVVAMTIFVTQDPASIYYAGLSLSIVAIGFLFHWTYKEAFAVSGLVLIFYLAACSPAILGGLSAKAGAGLFSNLVFLVATGAVVVAGSAAHREIRVEEFRGRDRLRMKKIALRENALALQHTLDELENAEGQLIQSGKMASLGQLSAGVIHEIGNPLNHVNQALFLLRRRLKQMPDDAVVGEAIADIEDSVGRMKDIVRDLREFSHPRSDAFAEVGVEEVVQVAIRMLGKAIGDQGVAIGGRIDPALRVAGVKNQLSQVFINLIHNAIQALAAADTGRERRILILTETRGEAVRVRVCDNGPGIPEPIRAKIFEPFFTTKGVGEGTGLGLSICFRIVAAHRGTMEVFSDGANFTEFAVTLPLLPSTEEAPATSAHHRPASAEAGNPEPSTLCHTVR
ncbi:MAG TPA: ATP-binding protein [Bacteroidia bacterium]|nr:ATP-binding protein [Bacteroidia bacterium]